MTTIGLNFGTIGSNASRDIGVIPNPSWDIEAFAKIGKVGIGDIDLSEDGTELYIVNLFTKQIHVLNLPSLTRANAFKNFGLRCFQDIDYPNHKHFVFV